MGDVKPLLGYRLGRLFWGCCAAYVGCNVYRAAKNYRATSQLRKSLRINYENVSGRKFGVVTFIELIIGTSIFCDRIAIFHYVLLFFACLCWWFVISHIYDPALSMLLALLPLCVQFNSKKTVLN
jgi:hypothetical protein